MPLRLLIACRSQYFSLLLPCVHGTDLVVVDSTLTEVLGILKLLKVLRVFKMARHFKGSRVIWLTLKESFRCLCIFLMLSIVFVSLAAYLIQLSSACVNDNCVFVDPVNTMYFVVITVTTVGYGDQLPHYQDTVPRLWTFICILFGSMFVALPLAIVGNKFEAVYKDVYEVPMNAETVSSSQRRQLLMNSAYQMTTAIHNAQRRFYELQTSLKSNEAASLKLDKRRVFQRAMHAISLHHDAIATHVDILTPSTVVMKTNQRPRGAWHSSHNSASSALSGAPSAVMKKRGRNASAGIQMTQLPSRQSTDGSDIKRSGSRTGEETEENEESTTNTLSFIGTVIGLGCGKNAACIEYAQADREEIGMGKQEQNVSVDRLAPPLCDSQLTGSQLHKFKQNLSVGMRVRVWPKDQTYYGISHHIAKTRKAHQKLVTKAKAGFRQGKCNDALWLWMNAPEGFDKKSCLRRSSTVFRWVHRFVIVSSILSIVIQTLNGINYYGPNEKACSLEASIWCENVEAYGGVESKRADRLPDDISEEDAAFYFQHVLNWPCYPQMCSTYSETEDLREPGKMLLCNDPAVDPSVNDLQWAGILEDPWSFPFSDPRLRMDVSCSTTSSTNATTYGEYQANGNYEETVETVDVVVGSEAFPSGIKEVLEFQNEVLFGQVAVCQRSKCISNEAVAGGNPPYRVFDADTVSQKDLNEFFGWMEFFFCVMYIFDFVLNAIAQRDAETMEEVGRKPFWKRFATWVELVSTVVCTAELVLVTLAASMDDAPDKDDWFRMVYTVWGMPFMSTLSTCIIRPLRIVVMIRVAHGFRDVPSLIVVSRTVKEVHRRLLGPLFYLIVIATLFAGIFFTFETLFYCEAVGRCQDGTYDLYECAGDDDTTSMGIGTIIEYRYKDTKCLITPTDGSPSPCYQGPDGHGNLGELCMVQNMYDALWLSFATLSTVGYGDIYPQTTLGKALGIVAAVAGTIYLSMPLAIIESRFYDIYEEYNSFVSLRSAKAKFQHAVGAVLTINTNKKGLGPATVEALESRKPGPLRNAIEKWDRQGKSKELPMYKRAVDLLQTLEKEQAQQSPKESGETDGEAPAEVIHQIDGFASAGGLFHQTQLRTLIAYCGVTIPEPRKVTEETFKQLDARHRELLAVIGEQYLFHDEWGVATAGPLKRREHDMH